MSYAGAYQGETPNLADEAELDDSITFSLKGHGEIVRFVINERGLLDIQVNPGLEMTAAAQTFIDICVEMLPIMHQQAAYDVPGSNAVN